jgi:hemerythrin-like domain-containing protein
MDILDALVKEHRLIEQLLDAFDWYSQAAFAGHGDKATLQSFCALTKDFADAMHHASEETILFRTMNEHGFSAHFGPVSVMLAEHDRGRSQLESLVSLAEKDAPWTNEDRQLVAHGIARFTHSLRAHIQKEDRVLYPMAEETLPEPARAAMNAKYAKLLRMQQTARDSLESEVRKLCARFSAPARAAVG